MGCHCPVLLIFRVFEVCFSLIVLAATGDIAHKFSQARQFNDDYDILDAPIPQIIDHMLATPHRIYLGMFVSIWTILVALYIIFVPRWRNAKFAPRGAIIGLEIPTIIFWFCAFIGLALFAAEVEPICLAVDDVPVVKKLIESCMIVKTAAAFAALSWFLWLITCVAVSVQACRSRRNKSKATLPPSGVVTGIDSNWTPVRGDMSKAEQGVIVTNVELLPR